MMMIVKETLDSMMTLAIAFIFFVLGCYWGGGEE